MREIIIFDTLQKTDDLFVAFIKVVDQHTYLDDDQQEYHKDGKDDRVRIQQVCKQENSEYQNRYPYNYIGLDGIKAHVFPIFCIVRHG